MTLAELSAASGVSVPTIKYYLREGLLPAGEPVGPKKAEYDDSHVARLRLIRILRDVGDVPVARIGDVVAALNDQDSTFHEVSARSFHALGPFANLPDTEAAHGARTDILQYLSEVDWIIDEAAPAIDVLTETLMAVRTFWDPEASPAVFNRYRAALDDLTRGDLAMIPDPPDMATYIAQTAVGTVLWDKAMIALRRLALEDKSRRRFA